jgi:Zn-dependent protease with chaperone function
MMTTVGLLLFAVLLAILGPRMVGTAWTTRAPRLGIVAWQAASAGVVLASVLAGVTLLVPVGAISHGLAAVLDACATTVAAVYRSPGRLPALLLAALLAGLVPLRLAQVAVGSWLRESRSRRELAISVLTVARPQPWMGALVVESDRAAAFCIPGRRRSVVLTSAAVDSLTRDELAAVLAHEQAHLRGRHHLVVGVARVLSRAFPWLPLFARATMELERLVEMVADDAAARRVDRVEVASALVSLSGMSAPRTALAAAQTAGALRVARLLRPLDPMGALCRGVTTAAILLVLSTPVVLAAWPLVAAVSSGLCVVPGVDRA